VREEGRKGRRPLKNTDTATEAAAAVTAPMHATGQATPCSLLHIHSQHTRRKDSPVGSRGGQRREGGRKGEREGGRKGGVVAKAGLEGENRV
jgi:hypothetical protein